MNRAPVVPDTEHRPAAVSEKLAALTATLTQQHEAKRALDALTPTYESRHTTDGDAALAALEAELPAPQPKAPAVELRYMKATNHLNACTRKAADLAAELTRVIQAEARDWYAAELQAAEVLESEVEADWANGVVRLSLLDAYARQWSVVSWVRIARTQVRDWTPPVDAAARNLRPGVNLLLATGARKIMADQQRQRAVNAERLAEQEAAVEAERQRVRARQLGQLEGEQRAQGRYLQTLRQLGGQ